MYFGLPVDQNVPAGEALEVDAMRPSLECQQEAVVHQPFPHHPVADAGLLQQLHGCPFEQAGANAPLNVGARLALENDTGYPLTLQQQREQHAGRPGADDHHLSLAHVSRCSGAPMGRGVASACDRRGSPGMDYASRNLYFSVMRPGQLPSTGEASSRPASVPAFHLYGESLLPPDERLIHIETIAARSRLHDWIIRPHRHRDLNQVLLIERGRVKARLDARVEVLRAPAVVLVPPGAVHSFRFRPETVGVVISFAATVADELRAASPGLTEHLERCVAIVLDRAALRQTDLSALARMLLREFGRSAPGRRLALRGTLAALLANLQRLLPDISKPDEGVSSRDRELVARFREQVEQRFRTHTALTEYAALLQTSESRLRRACLAVAGQSPVDLVHIRLLLEAERQLRYTSMSVTQVAYHLGFEDRAYFSRFFTRRMGVSPRVFRQGNLSG